MSAFLSCQNVAHFMLYCLKLFEQIGKSNYEVFSTIELLTKCFHKKRNHKAWIFAEFPIGIHKKFRRHLVFSDRNSWRIPMTYCLLRNINFSSQKKQMTAEFFWSPNHLPNEWFSNILINFLIGSEYSHFSNQQNNLKYAGTTAV